MSIERVAIIGKGAVGLLYGSLIARNVGEDAVHIDGALTYTHPGAMRPNPRRRRRFEVCVSAAWTAFAAIGSRNSVSCRTYCSNSRVRPGAEPPGPPGLLGGIALIKELVHDQILLAQVAEPATAEDAAVAQDLADTMKSLEDCACLAANQIGVNKAIVAYEQKGHVHVLYNPKVMMGIKPFKAQEGCLSLETTSYVKRFKTVRVSFQELVGDQLVPRTRTFQDWTAQCVQHGIDHCEGKLV